MGAQPARLEGRGSSASQGLFVRSFTCSPSVCVGSPQVPGNPATAGVRAQTHVHHSILGFDRFPQMSATQHTRGIFAPCRRPPRVSTLQCDDTSRHSGLTRSVYFFPEIRADILYSVSTLIPQVDCLEI